MDASIHLRWHFAVPIFEKVVEGYAARKEAVVRSVLALRDSDTSAVVRSNQGGFHSHDRLHESTDPDLAWLFRAIGAISARCVESFEGDRPHGGCAIVSAWANVNERGDWALPHIHLPCDWSGVFYADAGGAGVTRTADGQVMFLNPLPLGERWRRANAATYAPRDGMLLFFPSFLMHLVAPHGGGSPRISIAWNAIVRPPPAAPTARGGDAP